ncbi:MAG: hypothetical protein FD135_2037 [Comamonadaceae bacterium]|nr:MAG: hypothetical protein FD135_2037 [Comamonadaceae bacterium]
MGERRWKLNAFYKKRICVLFFHGCDSSWDVLYLSKSCLGIPHLGDFEAYF